MRKIIWTSAALAALVLGPGASPARATEVEVKVPFPFFVYGEKLPAGDYVIESIDQAPDAIMIRSRHQHDRAQAVVLTGTADGHDPAGDRPALTFSHDENQYRLSKIWESRSDGRVLRDNRS
jgi:hypothetical protein